MLDVPQSSPSAPAPSSIGVEVVYALPDQQVVVELRLPAMATARIAIDLSGLRARFPDIAIERDGVGIFGRRCGLDESLMDGDRIELYRPLTADAKVNRHRRVAAARARKNRSKWRLTSFNTF